MVLDNNDCGYDNTPEQEYRPQYNSPNISPVNLISTDSGNSISVGVDGKIFYKASNNSYNVDVSNKQDILVSSVIGNSSQVNLSATNLPSQVVQLAQYVKTLQNSQGSGSTYNQGSGILISNNLISVDCSQNPCNYVKTITVNGGSIVNPVNGNINLSVSGSGTFTETPISTVQSDTITFNAVGTSSHTLNADVRISNIANNLLSKNSTGLFVLGSTASAVNKDPVSIVNNSADIASLQTIGAGTQLFNYTGTAGSVALPVGSANLKTGFTYSIDGANKVSDLSTVVAQFQIFTGNMIGGVSNQIPVINTNRNGCQVYEISFRRTGGTVAGGNSITLNVNGVATSYTLNLSTTNELSTLVFSTLLNLLETDEVSFTEPNNTSLSGMIMLYNIENPIN